MASSDFRGLCLIVLENALNTHYISMLLYHSALPQMFERKLRSQLSTTPAIAACRLSSDFDLETMRCFASHSCTSSTATIQAKTC